MAGRAGERNALIRFERRAAVSDGGGNTVGDWARLCGPFRARLRALPGREEVLQQRLAGLAPYEITVLASAATRGVTVQDRAVNTRTGATYDVVEIRNPDERGRELVMLVRAGAADG